jgi:hypothetical protein
MLLIYYRSVLWQTSAKPAAERERYKQAEVRKMSVAFAESRSQHVYICVHIHSVVCRANHVLNIQANISDNEAVQSLLRKTAEGCRHRQSKTLWYGVCASFKIIFSLSVVGAVGAAAQCHHQHFHFAKCLWRF